MRVSIIAIGKCKCLNKEVPIGIDFLLEVDIEIMHLCITLYRNSSNNKREEGQYPRNNYSCYLHNSHFLSPKFYHRGKKNARKGHHQPYARIIPP